MKRKRDFTMLYAVLAGFAFFVILPIVVVCVIGYPTEPSVSLPTGSRIQTVDTFGGFPAYGIEMHIVQIPPEKSEEFEKHLREEGFFQMPLPADVHETISFDSDTEMLAGISNGLWWFENRGSGDGKVGGIYENFDLLIFDFDTCTYYDLHYSL